MPGGFASSLLPALVQEGKGSLAALVLVLLHTRARCTINDCLDGKELQSTCGLEPGCIKEKLMTDIYMEMSINVFFMLFVSQLKQIGLSVSPVSLSVLNSI